MSNRYAYVSLCQCTTCLSGTGAGSVSRKRVRFQALPCDSHEMTVVFPEIIVFCRPFCRISVAMDSQKPVNSAHSSDPRIVRSIPMPLNSLWPSQHHSPSSEGSWEVRMDDMENSVALFYPTGSASWSLAVYGRKSGHKGHKGSLF